MAKQAVERRKTRQVRIGSVKIGGGAPVSVQSMIKVPTSDAPAAVRQIRRLERTGCEIVRLAVRSEADLAGLAAIRRKVKAPIEADIHFHHRFALSAIDAGADCVRLNPGNVRRQKDVEEVIDRAKAARIPVRIGLNSGSLPPGKGGIPERMSRAFRDYLRIFEKKEFFDLIVSLKTADPASCVEANRRMAKFCDYPFHLGVTATGAGTAALIKSAIGIGALLLDGIGDTIRVSLTADPVEEVVAGQEILQALGIRSFRPFEIIACPTCGRCEIDLPRIVREVTKRLFSTELTTHNSQLTTQHSIKIAVMGCAVNGPGEAKAADLGIAGGRGSGLLFRKGRILRKVKEGRLVSELLKEIIVQISAD